MIVYDWAGVTSANPITSSQIGPWQHLQEVAASRLVGVAGNPITGRFSAKFIVNSASDRGDPASPNPRTEVYSGGNGAGIIPLNTLAYHGWAFTPVSGNTTTWLNWLQLHGAVSGSQPCFQVKTDHSGGFYCRTNPDGTDRSLATTTPYGKLVRIIAAVKPSTSSSGILQVWISIDGAAYVQKVDYTGRVGFAATYPKGFIYGDAGGSNFPWVNISHKTIINAPDYATVEAGLALASGGGTGGGGTGGGGGTPPPPTIPDLPAVPDAVNKIPSIQTPGASWTTMGADKHRFMLDTAPEGGTISEIVAGIDGNGSGTGTALVRGVLGDYFSSTALGVTSEVSIAKGTAAAWVRLALPSPVHVTPGQEITVGLFTGGATNVARVAHDASGSATLLLVDPDTYADGISSPWTVTTTDQKIISVYALLVPDVPGSRTYLLSGRGYVSGGRGYISGGRASTGTGGFGA